MGLSDTTMILLEGKAALFLKYMEKGDVSKYDEKNEESTFHVYVGNLTY